MKKVKKFLVGLLALASVSAFALGVVACDTKKSMTNNMSSMGTENGTYYYYEDGEYDENHLILDNSKWMLIEETETLLTGTYTVTNTLSGKSITLSWYDGTQRETIVGTVEKGILHIGETHYCMEGFIPE